MASNAVAARAALRYYGDRIRNSPTHRSKDHAMSILSPQRPCPRNAPTPVMARKPTARRFAFMSLWRAKRPRKRLFLDGAPGDGLRRGRRPSSAGNCAVAKADEYKFDFSLARLPLSPVLRRITSVKWNSCTRRLLWACRISPGVGHACIAQE